MNNEDKTFTAIIVFWILSLIASIGIWAVIIWAIIKLVNEYA